MFTGAIAGHVRNLLELHRAASRIRPHPPGGHLAHPPCRLNDLKGFTRLGIVILSFQSVLGSPLLCGNSRSRSLVGNLTSPNDGPLYLYPSHLSMPPSLEFCRPSPKGVAVEAGLRKVPLSGCGGNPIVDSVVASLLYPSSSLILPSARQSSVC